MNNKFKDIYDNTIPHSSFISESAILSCMHQSYQLAIQDLFEYLSSNGQINGNVKIIQIQFERHKNVKT